MKERLYVVALDNNQEIAIQTDEKMNISEWMRTSIVVIDNKKTKTYINPQHIVKVSEEKMEVKE